MYIEKLLGRTLLVHLRASPAPATLGESLALHTTLTDFIGSRGTIMHYRQQVCPVTKERLPSIRLMVEDFARKAQCAEQTPLERDLQEIETKFDYLQTTSMTRDEDKIMSI